MDSKKEWRELFVMVRKANKMKEPKRAQFLKKIYRPKIDRLFKNLNKTSQQLINEGF